MLLLPVSSLCSLQQHGHKDFVVGPQQTTRRFEEIGRRVGELTFHIRGCVLNSVLSCDDQIMRLSVEISIGRKVLMIENKEVFKQMSCRLNIVIQFGPRG